LIFPSNGDNHTDNTNCPINLNVRPLFLTSIRGLLRSAVTYQVPGKVLLPSNHALQSNVILSGDVTITIETLKIISNIEGWKF
jgi:hypothetical protein